MNCKKKTGFFPQELIFAILSFQTLAGCFFVILSIFYTISDTGPQIMPLVLFCLVSWLRLSCMILGST